MKLYKKIIAASLVGVIATLNINTITAYTNKVNNNLRVEKTSNQKSQDILKEEKIVNIKKINTDSSDNPISAENVNLKNRNVNLSDGLYTLDYGDGWVKGGDAGFIGSIIVPDGTTGIFSKDHTEGFSDTVIRQKSASFTTGYISVVVESAYGTTSTEGISTEIYQSITAPKGKNLFVKVQGTYRKIDVIRVEDGNIIDWAETYKPTSYAFRQLEYANGERVDQTKLYERETNCILGNSGYEFSGVVDPDAKYEGYVKMNDAQENFFNTKYYDRNDTIGIYFTVPRDGKYEFKEELSPKSLSPWWKTIYVGVQKPL